MKPLFLSLFALLVLITSSIAQDRPELAVSNIPSELLEGANAVIRYDYGTFKVKSPGEAKATYKFIVTRLNKKAGFEDLRIYHDAELKLRKINIRLYDESGNLIRKIDKKEIKDRSAFDGVSLHSDSRYYFADLSYAQYPYTIEYEYSKEYSGITTYPSCGIQTTTKTSIEKFGYAVSVPPTINLKYWNENSDLEPNITESPEGIKTYTWSTQNLKPLKYEPFAPVEKSGGSRILFAVDNFKVAGYDGSMADWASYGKFMYELNQYHNNLTPEMKATIKSLVAEANTDAEKIDILFKYIQKNMRYVSIQLGIGGWMAYDAAYVEKNKYGDCKALTWFMNSMLEEVGIESYPALVRAGEKYSSLHYPEGFCYPAFNHVILHVPSEDMWLECTDNFFPTGYQSDFTDDRSVLLITEEGGVLSSTPKIPIEQNLSKSQSTLELSEKGAVIAKSTTHYSGPKHETFRQLKAYYSQEEFEKWFLKSSSLPSFFITELKTEVEKESPNATLSYEVDIPKYASKAGSRLFLPINRINPFENPLPKTKERIHPVKVVRGYMEEDQITISFPENYHIESIPEEAMNIESDYGIYNMSIEKKAGELIYHRQLKIVPTELPADRYNELRDFYKKIEKADKMKVVLVSKT